MMTDVATAKARASTPHTRKEDELLFTLEALLRRPQSHRWAIRGQTGECYHPDWGPFTRSPSDVRTAMVRQKVATGHAYSVTRSEETPSPQSHGSVNLGAHSTQQTSGCQRSSGEAPRNCWALVAAP